MIPSTNTTCEADFQMAVPKGITVHGQRLWITTTEPAMTCSTAWRSVEAVAAIEDRIGKPVVSSNQSTIWASLRVLGATEPVKGFGRLLEQVAA
jgi:maleate cis-trans isomerase